MQSKAQSADMAQLGKERAAAGGRYRRSSEVKKQEAMRNAPSEQCDYVFEGRSAHS